MTTDKEWDQAASLKRKALRVIALDGNRKPLHKAGTAFLTSGIQRKNGTVEERIFLYTCFHVATGVNPLDIKYKDLPRRFLRVSSAPFRPADGVSTSSGRPAIALHSTDKEDSFDIPLYEDAESFPLQPTWEQGSDSIPDTDLNNTGAVVPVTDVVRFDVTDFNLAPFNIDIMKFGAEDIGSLCVECQDVVVIGYPYGYSPNHNWPEPVFIKRSVAHASLGNTMVYLDGPASPGMSGSPVVRMENGGWKLVGIYKGSIFPDAKNPNRESLGIDKFSALGLMDEFYAAYREITNLEVRL